MTASDAREEYTKHYGELSIIPQVIIDNYLDDNNTTEEPPQESPEEPINHTTEEPINHTGAHELLHNPQPAVSITDSSSTNDTVKNVNLSGPVFTKLLMELYTYDQKTALQGKLKRNIAEGKTFQEKLKSYKHLTSSKIIQLGTHRLCHNICTHLCNEEDRKNNEESASKRNRYLKKSARKKKADELRLKTVSELKNDEISFPCRYKGIASNNKMSDAKKQTLTLRWSQIRSRRSPNVTPYNSSDDDMSSDDNAGNENLPDDIQFRQNYTGYNLDAPCDNVPANSEGQTNAPTKRDDAAIGLLMNISNQH